MPRKRRAHELREALRYDSVVALPGQMQGHHSHQLHTEVVIFDRDQAYPEYIVHYRMRDPWRPV